MFIALRSFFFILLLAISSLAMTTSFNGNARAQSKRDSSVKTERRPRVKDTVGVVDGVVIRYGDFKAHLNKLISERATNNKINDSEYTLCVNDTWDELTASIFFREEAQARHIRLTDRQIRDSLTINPPKSIVQVFSDGGKSFDREKFRIVIEDTSSAIGKQFVLLARPEYEDEIVRQAITHGAKSPQDAQKRFIAWLRKRLANSKFEDRRTAFGFY